MKKKMGITVVEVIVTMAVSSIFLSLIYPIFTSGQKTLIKLSMQKDLQADSIIVENRITEKLVQANGIDKITRFGLSDIVAEEGPSSPGVNDLSSLDSNNSGVYKIDNIKEIYFSNKRIVETQDPSDPSKTKIEEEEIDYVFKIENIGKYKVLSIGQKKSEEDDSLYKFTELSRNISDITIVSTSKIFGEEKYIRVIVDFYKKQGITEVNHKIESLITYRNK